jgi:C-terminal processing protease CtpA/Prc
MLPRPLILQILLLAALAATAAAEPPVSSASSAAPAISATPAVAAPKPNQLDLPALVAALGSESWPARQKAEDQLTAAGPDVLARLDPFLARATDAEVLWRLQRLYRALTPPDRYAADGQPAYMGINFAMVSAGNDARLTDRQWGVRLDVVLPGSPAEQAGLAVDDLIVTINGEPFVGSYSDGAANQALVERIQSYGVGAEVKVVFFRGQERRQALVKLAPRPDGFVQTLGPAQKWARYWTKHLAGLRAAAK